MEEIYVDAIHSDEVIDLHHISSLPVLRKLRLRGKLERLPEWIPRLLNLVKLSMISFKLSDDSLKSIKCMFLSLDSAYGGDSLHFQGGGFEKLKKLSLRHILSLKSIIVEEGALPLLEEFMLEYIPQLKEVPFGIDRLGKLQVFHIINMPEEFRKSIREEQWINKQVRQVNITDQVRQR